MYQPWNKLTRKLRARGLGNWDYEKNGPMMARIPIKLGKSLFKPPVVGKPPVVEYNPEPANSLPAYTIALKEVWDSDILRAQMYGASPFIKWDPERWAWQQAVEHAQRISAAREEWPWPDFADHHVTDEALDRSRYYGRVGFID